MPRPREDEDTRKVARFLAEGYSRRGIAGLLKWKPSRVLWHIKKLKADHAFYFNGIWRKGRNADRWLRIRTTPVQGGQSNPNHPHESEPPLPSYILSTGAQFTIPITNSNGQHLKPHHALNQYTRVHQGKLDLGDDLRATYQVFNEKTITLTINNFDLPAETDSAQRVNAILSEAVWESISQLSKRLKMALGLPTPILNSKARAAAANGEIPILAGELVVPIPGLEDAKARIQLSPTLEINSSPPGTAAEFGSVDEAVAYFQLPRRVTAMEKFQLQQAEVAEKILTALENLNTFLAGAGEIQSAGPGPEVR